MTYLKCANGSGSGHDGISVSLVLWGTAGKMKGFKYASSTILWTRSRFLQRPADGPGSAGLSFCDKAYFLVSPQTKLFL